MNARYPNLATLARAVLASLLLAASAGAVAAAQAAPPPAAPQQAAPPAVALPSYATPVTDQEIRGKIAAITGKYTLTLHDEHGYLDSVTLHQGTIITPTGLTLQPGMRVTIGGTVEGATFAANRIDTPYTLTLVQPAYPVYGAGFGWGWGWGRWGWGAGWGWGPGYGPGLWW